MRFDENSFSSLIDIILEAERTHQMFMLKEEEVYLYKLIRFKVFSQLLEKVNNINSVQAPPESTKEKIKYLPYLFKNSFWNNPFFKKNNKKNWVVDHARRVLVNGKYIDIYTDYFVNENNSETALFKRFNIRDKMSVSDFSADAIYLTNAILKKIRKTSLSDATIQTLFDFELELMEQTGFRLNIIHLAKEHLEQFKSIYSIYHKLFSIQKPENLYVVVSYGLEPMIAAAQDNGVKVIEFQHGVIGPYHLGYHFPEIGRVPYFPDEILLFGEFWEETTSLPENVKRTYYGYPYLNDRVEKNNSEINSKNSKHIAVVSQGTVGKELSEYVYELAQIMPDYYFTYKLHPGEFGRWKDEYPLLTKLKDFDNVEVLENERNMYDIFSKVKHVVGVSSTALFEALAFKTQPIVIQLSGYEYMLDLNKHYKVPIVNGVRETKNFIYEDDLIEESKKTNNLDFIFKNIDKSF